MLADYRFRKVRTNGPVMFGKIFKIDWTHSRPKGPQWSTLCPKRKLELIWNLRLDYKMLPLRLPLSITWQWVSHHLTLISCIKLILITPACRDISWSSDRTIPCHPHFNINYNLLLWEIQKTQEVGIATTNAWCTTSRPWHLCWWPGGVQETWRVVEPLQLQ